MQELERIVESLREPLRRFALRIQDLGKDNALGWSLYGAIVAGTFNPKRHSVQSVLMLGSVDLELLRRLAAEGPEHAQFGLAAPLVMTPAHFQAFQDAFPLELIEIHQQYLIVFGEDYFGDLKFENRNVRLQCERELEVLSIGLRQGLLAASGKEKHLTMLQRDWVHGLVRTLRGMLWLKGQTEGLPTDRVLSDVERIVERPLAGIRRILGESEPPGWEAFKNLYADVEALGVAVDGW